MLKAIDKKSVHKICSGQVVTDLPNAVKELIENSIDANATKITIRLVENGLDLITVVDNGTGIPPSEYEKITMKYFTSKIERFEDIKKLKSLGFRGEALSSLCQICSKFTIATRYTQTLNFSQQINNGEDEEEDGNNFNEEIDLSNFDASDEENDIDERGTLLTFSKDGKIISETPINHHVRKN